MHYLQEGHWNHLGDICCLRVYSACSTLWALNYVLKNMNNHMTNMNYTVKKKKKKEKDYIEKIKPDRTFQNTSISAAQSVV